MKPKKTSAGFRLVEEPRLVTLKEIPPEMKTLSVSGSAAKGRTYENKVGRWLQREFPLQYKKEKFLEYRDKNGRGVNIVDHLLEFEDRFVVVECKLSSTLDAIVQLEETYLPLLRKACAKPVQAVVIYKSLRQRLPLPEVEDFSPLLILPIGIYQFQWLP